MKAVRSEEQWLMRLQKLLDDIPPDCWIFAADGKLHLMRYRDGMRAVDKHKSMDSGHSVGTASGPEIDGGDW